jgi:hypothetical protein
MMRPGFGQNKLNPKIIPHEVASTFIQHLWFQHVKGKMQIKPLLSRFGVANGHHLFTRIQFAN